MTAAALPAPAALLSMLADATKDTSGYAVVRLVAAPSGLEPAATEFTIRRFAGEFDHEFVARCEAQIQDGDDLHFHFEAFKPTLLRITRRPRPRA